MNLSKPQQILFIAITFLTNLSYGLTLTKERYQSINFVVVEVSTKDNLQLFWQNANQEPYGSFRNLSRRLAKDKVDVLFATNSGIFGQDQKPLGWHVENQQKLQAFNKVTRDDATGNFSLIPNGVFFIDQDGKGHVIESETFLQTHENYQYVYGTQSGPMLLTNNQMHPKFFASSESIKYRSGVCAKGNNSYFVITEEPINFYYFAKFFQDQLSCTDALYLDGTLSQFYYQGQIYGAPFWNVRTYVGIWAVTKPSQSE